MKDVLLAAVLLMAGYFIFRCAALKRALRDAAQEMTEIAADLSRNRFLHLPMPDEALERFIGAVNSGLEAARRERCAYERREREFQQQIENISHDLRTPLTVILGYLQLMKEPGAGAESLEVIERSARTMERLVGQFYLYSQINAQDYTLTCVPLDVGRLLRESLLANEQVLARAGLEVTCSLPDGPVTVWGEAQALERVFANLFQNAGRYACSELFVGLKEEEDGAEISFINDTEALLPEDVSQLFERFYRQDSARGQGSSGLGLTVAKGLAEAMGGKLTAERRPMTDRTAAEEAGSAKCTRSRLCLRLRLGRG